MIPLRTNLAVPLLLLVALASVGAGHCNGGGSSGAALAFRPGTLSLATGETATVDVLVALPSGASLQALELDLAAELPVVAIDAVAPHPDFDDDGAWLVAPTLRFLQGTADDAVDLRHGPSPASGQLGVARVTVRAIQPGEGRVRIAGGRLADPQGQALPVGARVALQVTVTP